MQVNPKEIIERNIVLPVKETMVQQVGIDLTLSELVSLEHGRAQNVLFQEKIALPVDMFALFFQRSSYSRRGIFVTTGVYDPNYSGSLGCTVYNLSGVPLEIGVGERIGQLVCFKADAASAYNGQWQNK